MDCWSNYLSDYSGIQVDVDVGYMREFKIDRQTRTVKILLIIGVVQALLYLFLIPPWWHYDEPFHFECIKTTADASFLHPPKRSRTSKEWRARVESSLVEYKYYHWSDSKPPSVLKGGTSCDAPFYYSLSSLPLRLPVLQRMSFAVQDRIVRFMSVLVFLLTLWIAWGVTGEVFHVGHPLRWMSVLFMALLPGFADAMTAINDDVGAILAFSIFFWIAIALVRRGFSLRRLILLVLSVIFCFYLNKPTSWVSVLIAPVVLLLSAFQRRLRWLPWTILFVSMVLIVGATISADDAALWYRLSEQSSGSRSLRLEAPFGAHVFRVSTDRSNKEHGIIAQMIPPKDMRLLSRAGRATVGVWMWSDKPVKAKLPMVRMVFYYNYAPWVSTPYVQLSTKPQFYSFVFGVPSVSKYGWLELYPRPKIKKGDQVVVFYDGLTLVPGKFESGMPVFEDPDLKRGQWNGKLFGNLVRNASAERAWLRLKTNFVSGKPQSYLSAVNTTLTSIADWPNTARYYRAIVRSFFQTFWSKVGIWLPKPSLSFRVLLVVTMSAFGGVIVVLIRNRRRFSWRIVFVLGISAAFTWGFAFVRGVGHLVKPVTFFNVMTWSRYAFPGIIPTALIFSTGCWEVMRLVRIPRQFRGVVFATFIFLVDVAALTRIVVFFWRLHLI